MPGLRDFVIAGELKIAVLRRFIHSVIVSVRFNLDGCVSLENWMKGEYKTDGSESEYRSGVHLTCRTHIVPCVLVFGNLTHACSAKTHFTD